jgi:hypothetical protein
MFALATLIEAAAYAQANFSEENRILTESIAL